MAKNLQYIVISDIGSTTTKAMLIRLQGEGIELMALGSSPTTVEAPYNDVVIGVSRSIRALESSAGISLLASTAETELLFNDGIGYLTTSSAGGGLQILVIGLTLFDSASSGKRAAFGAGGIILDTFALDDRRKAVDQMLAIRNLHPDLVLVCGGTDGGAVTGVLRLTEILRLANPSPKFDEAGKIPAIFAGNTQAAQIIRHMISREFDLHILPNLRPSPTVENLKPTQEMIQKLFMENVMEKAPGYNRLKGKAVTEIKPTPLAVLDCLDIFSSREGKNILAIDIGGATTDIFTYINGHSQRTVSANLGMSYSAMNVMREYSPDRLMSLLPAEVDKDAVRNYIGNKTISPTSIPVNDLELMIEHALARSAISMAITQHQDMHYNTMKIGFLDILKQGLRDKYEEKFEYQKEEESHYFYTSDIDVIIGSGGVFAKVRTPEQAMMILVDACRPKGITELWLDEEFCAPHLGILSSFSPDHAAKLLASGLIKPIAMHLAPIFNPGVKKDKVLCHIEIEGKEIALHRDELHYFGTNGHTRELHIKLAKDVSLGKPEKEIKLKTDRPIIIDSRVELGASWEKIPEVLRPYNWQDKSVSQPEMSIAKAERGDYRREIILPYKGEIYAVNGSQVSPSDIVAANPFDPARLFIVQPFGANPYLTADLMLRNIKVQIGDNVDFDQVLAFVPNNLHRVDDIEPKRPFPSPVRGKVEYIDANTGMIVMSEIQDYSAKPVLVHAAKLLKLKNNKITPYLTRLVGDFVYQGDVIARRVDKTSSAGYTHVKSPSTGTIISADNSSGDITIRFLSKPHEYHSLVFGHIEREADAQKVCVCYRSSRIYGKIGFGRETGGIWVSEPEKYTEDKGQLSGKIIYVSRISRFSDLERYADSGIAGLVCDTISESALAQFLRSDPGVINTGGEALAFSLLVLAGFSSESADSGNQSQMKTYDGRYVYLNPHTRLRAGVIRPSLNLFNHEE